MSVVILAEWGGNAWIVGGLEYMDQLMFNDMPDWVGVEFVACDSPAAVNELYRLHAGPAPESEQPWLLNPKIVERVRQAYGPARRAIDFAPWSVMLEPQALELVGRAAAWLRDNPGGRLVLRQFAAEGVAPGHADVQRLRGQLVAAALGREGVDGAAIGTAMDAASDAAEGERLEIVMEAAPG